MKKGTVSRTMLKDKILPDLVSKMNGAVDEGELRIFYKMGSSNDTTQVIFLIKEYDEGLENEIYSSQFRILNKYPDSSIDFRMIPKYKKAIRDLIPENFLRYAIH